VSIRFFYPDVPPTPLPPGHRFPNTKYALLRDKIARENTLGPAALVPSPMATRAELLTVHDAAYVDAIFDGSIDPAIIRRIGLPWSEALVTRALTTVGGSLAAAREALVTGISGQLAGGTHHAHRDFGSGFCVFNDLAIVTTILLSERTVDRVAIVDLDVHQGDGTAAILAAEPRAFTLSIQGQKNFPFRRMTSSLDVELPDGTEDRAYLVALTDALHAVVAFRPDLVLYLSGADPLAEDRLGRLSLTHEGLMERDRFVFETFRRRGVPVSIAIGGGYGEPISATVEGYANTFRTAREVYGF
jgi:acetoin utilization deacetylase AcuC-like enzyme